MKNVDKMILVPYQEESGSVEKSGLRNACIKEEFLIDSLPKTFRNKARTLLSYAEHTLGWNEKGELSLEGTVVGGTNVGDLLRYNFREFGKTPPSGYHRFRKALTDLNLPQSLMPQNKNYVPEAKSRADYDAKGWIII